MMGFSKNWLEEIVSEWLSLKGYSVETNVPLSSKIGGGRGEADVLGFKLDNDKLVLAHAEASVQLTKSHADNVVMIKKKFSDENTNTVIEIARARLGNKAVGSVQHIFVSALVSSRGEAQNLKNVLKTINIEFMEFPELIKNCMDAISNEGDKRVKWGLNKTSDYNQAIFAALPDGLWFMKMLGMMQRHRMLNISEKPA
ncbi:MAG: hypothetical protein ACYDCP_00425 [Thermoplasmataceae archaeon]